MIAAIGLRARELSRAGGRPAARLTRRSAEGRVRIVVNADDFGASAETVAATIQCFEHGALTSATIMPTMPAADEALAFARDPLRT